MREMLAACGQWWICDLAARTQLAGSANKALLTGCRGVRCGQEMLAAAFLPQQSGLHPALSLRISCIVAVLVQTLSVLAACTVGGMRWRVACASPSVVVTASDLQR